MASSDPGPAMGRMTAALAPSAVHVVCSEVTLHDPSRAIMSEQALAHIVWELGTSSRHQVPDNMVHARPYLPRHFHALVSILTTCSIYVNILYNQALVPRGLRVSYAPGTRIASLQLHGGRNEF